MTILATLHETIELIVQAPTQQQKAKGKWHERFGRNR
jgi:sister chromatid cohesion protein DCC1